MFDITYLSSDNRRTIDTYKKRLEEGSVAQDEIPQVHTKIVELEAQTKSYKLCTTQESLDLKQQMFDKLDKLMKIGKQAGARQFFAMMQVVDEHIKRLYLEERKREQEALIQPRSIDDRPDSSRPARVGSDDKPESGSTKISSNEGRSRWTSGFNKRNRANANPQSR